MRLFTNLITEKAGLRYVNNFPVFLLYDPGAAKYLLKKGINISSFPYPDPLGKAMNRIVINSTNRIDELKILAAALNQLD